MSIGSRPARATLMALLLVSACGGGGDDPAEGGPPRGPEGGVLRFDAAMLVEPPDASVWMPGDGGTPIRVDSGPPTGFDAGRRTCGGSAFSCTLVGTSGCISQRGCRRDGECTGSARSCYSFTYSSSCYSQEGCYWSSGSDYCGGTARSCNSMTYSSECGSQERCRWDNTCEGTSTPCSLLSEFECESQQGCYLR